jgi:hypothetical protein
VIERLRTWLRQRLCAHRCYIEDIARVPAPADLAPVWKDGNVASCPCHLCGRILFAPYGLALPATLDQKGYRLP